MWAQLPQVRQPQPEHRARPTIHSERALLEPVQQQGLFSPELNGLSLFCGVCGAAWTLRVQPPIHRSPLLQWQRVRLRQELRFRSPLPLQELPWPLSCGVGGRFF
ncbi:hypothetical protein CIW82_16060 [Acetobacter tropicalis]|uniref:Uncharacterized protein n=1 Tax=Acetobacter tropicalis TaxID=104102 RepID=A0A291PKF9_9PROT|nr:hypothetical protein CIW82_16060 [Acetobacter tropicalis]